MEKQKHVIDAEKAFDQGHLKSCSALCKTCKNCGKPNHFAKKRRSQQVSEVTEDSERSKEECDLEDTESGGGLNVAIKRAKPNTAGPSSIPGPKTQELVALK